MSWDLYVGDEWVGNHTHNTNPMLRLASLAGVQEEFSFEQPGIAAEVLFRAPREGQDWGNFDGLPARFAGEFARRVAHELRARPEKYDRLNPDNGWGSRDTLVEFLDRVAAACGEQPDAVFGAGGAVLVGDPETADRLRRLQGKEEDMSDAKLVEQARKVAEEFFKNTDDPLGLYVGTLTEKLVPALEAAETRESQRLCWMLKEVLCPGRSSSMTPAQVRSEIDQLRSEVSQLRKEKA